MSVSPPFAISETLPADTDLISIFPSQEHPFRDTVESWLTFLSDPTTGLLKATAFAFPLVITNAGTSTFLQLQSTDAGAAAGPGIELYRNSASPAVSDLLGIVSFTGKSSTGVIRTYADDFVTITDPVNTTEDATRTFRVIVAGTTTARLTLNSAGVAVTGTLSSGALTVTGAISATTTITATGAGSFAGITTTAAIDLQNGVIGRSGATISLRPNGTGSTTGQFSVNATGDVVVSANVNAVQGIFSGAVSGTTGTFAGAVTSSQNFVTTSVNAVFANNAAGTLFFRPNGAGSSTGQTTISSAGNMTVAGDVTASSDRRLKKSISPLGREWASKMVREVVPVTYLHKKNDQRGIGFIAQEVQPYAGELVHEDPRGMLSLAYPNMVAILWEAVRELQDKVAALEAK